MSCVKPSRMRRASQLTPSLGRKFPTGKSIFPGKAENSTEGDGRVAVEAWRRAVEFQDSARPMGGFARCCDTSQTARCTMSRHIANSTVHDVATHRKQHGARCCDTSQTARIIHDVATALHVAAESSALASERADLGAAAPEPPAGASSVPERVLATSAATGAINASVGLAASAAARDGAVALAAPGAGVAAGCACAGVGWSSSAGPGTRHTVPRGTNDASLPLRLSPT